MGATRSSVGGLTPTSSGPPSTLAVATGVLLWVSFLDIVGGHVKELFELSYEHDHEHGVGDDHGGENVLQIRGWTALFFFVGLAATVLMDVLVVRCLGHVLPDITTTMQREAIRMQQS